MRNFLLISSIFCLLISWGPLFSISTFSEHMICHMLVVAVASPLLALYLNSFSFSFPSFMLASIPAAFVELIIVWGWHLPKLHLWARHSYIGYIFEQTMFLLAGVWVWLSSFAGNKGLGIIALLMTSMHMTLLGALLVLTKHSLFLHHSLEDQYLGGVIMLVIGGISYLVGGLFLTSKLLKNLQQEDYSL